jgi:hypothetical protein
MNTGDIKARGIIGHKERKKPIEQKASSPLRSMRSLWQNLLLVLTVLVAFPATAQIQQAWVAHYDNGFPGGTNQAVKMALDAAGNIYITGFSQNVYGNLGYVTIKYAPNGNQLWAARYDSLNYQTSTIPAAMALDASNNVIVTGTP